MHKYLPVSRGVEVRGVVYPFTLILTFSVQYSLNGDWVPHVHRTVLASWTEALR